MSSIVSDRPLRRLVAELAAAAPEDVDAVLAQLDERPRAEVKALLAAYYGYALEGAAPGRTSTVDQVSVQGLSPWLARRVRGGAFGDDDHALTSHAAHVLRECASALPPEARPPRAAFPERLVEAFEAVRTRAVSLIGGSGR